MSSIRKLNNIIRKKDIIDKLFIDSIKSDIIRLYDIDGELNDSFVIFIIEYVKKNGDIRTLKNYINRCGLDNFDIERFYNYLEYRKLNRSDSMSENFFKLVYGEVKYKEHHHTRIKSRKNMYDPSYISIRDNINKEEAIEKILEFKKNKNTSLEGFIKRHGEEMGNFMFMKFQETSKHNLEKYLKKYGNDGYSKYEEYLSKKDSMSFKWAIKKTNGDVEKANELVKNRKESVRIDFDKIVQKFNGDIEMSLEYYNDLNERKTNKKYTSKESLLILKPIFDELLGMGYDKKDLFLGDVTLEKYFYDIEYKRGYFYDFTNMVDKYIIEYNGDYFHPRYEKYSMSEIMDKHNYFYNVDDKIEYDKRKINFIEESGYNVLVLWSEDGIDFNTKKAIEFINKNKTII